MRVTNTKRNSRFLKIRFFGTFGHSFGTVLLQFSLVQDSDNWEGWIQHCFGIFETLKIRRFKRATWLGWGRIVLFLKAARSRAGGEECIALPTGKPMRWRSLGVESSRQRKVAGLDRRGHGFSNSALYCIA